MNKKLHVAALCLGTALATVSLNGCVAALVGAGAAGAAGGAMVGAESRTVDLIYYDEKIEYQAKRVLSDHRAESSADNWSVTALAICGNVLLAGETTNTSYLKWCEDEIRKIEHVRNVYNYVQLKEPVGASVVASDTLITTKVKSALLFGKQISSGRFKVFTEDSNVFLMGYVTRDEAARAVNQTKKVSGVNRIITIFDYMDALNDSPTVSQVQGEVTAQTPTPVVNNSSSLASELQSTVDNGGAAIIEDSSTQLQSASW